MADTAELDVAPYTIEATLNYIVDDGKPVFTIVAAPGGSDTRSGATPDPRRVTIHNGRPHANDFVLEENGFRVGQVGACATDRRLRRLSCRRGGRLHSAHCCPGRRRRGDGRCRRRRG